MIANYVAVFATLSAPVFAGPVYRLVAELDQNSFGQAQQRDDTATRALTNTTIQTSDGKCLFVDKLSGDSAANLTPIQVAACGATEGQGFDVITQGKHNNVDGSILIVSTLTQACFTYDPTQATGKQVILFSCGGVADGSGNVTTSQLFAGDGSAGSHVLAPENQATSCFTVKGNSVEIADCVDGEESQTFTFGVVVSESDDDSEDPASSVPATTVPATDSPATSATTAEQLVTATCDPVTVTESVTVTVTTSVSTAAAVEESSSTDTTTTTTLFITVNPASTTDELVVTSSTTTVFITVPNPSAHVSSSAPAATSTAAAVSSKVPSNPNTIPQISINPTTTATANPSDPSTSVVATTASASPEISSSAAVSTTAPVTSKVAANPNTIPQVSISPHTTVVVS